MRALSGSTIAALSGAELSIVQLIYMQFPGFPVALNSSNRDFDFGGVTYRGAAGLGTVNPIDDAPGEIKGIQLMLSGVPAENLALALDDAAIVQGAPITIRLALLDANHQIVEAPIDWDGQIDTMGIEEDGETCTIAVTAESSAVDLLRGNALTTSDADQQFLYPGDLAFQYVVSQASQPVVWPTKQYYIASR